MSIAGIKETFFNAAHNISAFVSNRFQTVHDAVQTFSNTLQQTEGHIGRKALEGLKDVWAGLREEGAMSAHQRHLDEFKLTVGGVATAAGTIEMNPVFAGSGAVPAWEAVLDLGKAGHQWRAAHNKL